MYYMVVSKHKLKTGELHKCSFACHDSFFLPGICVTYLFLLHKQPGSFEEKKKRKGMSILYEPCESLGSKQTACQYQSKAKNYKTNHSNSPFQVSPRCCIINNIIAWGYVDTGTDNATFVLEVKKEAKTEHILWQQTDSLLYQM